MFAPFDEIDKKLYHLILIKSRTFLRHTSNNNTIKALYINLSVFFVPHTLGAQCGQGKEIRWVPMRDKKEKFEAFSGYF